MKIKNICVAVLTSILMFGSTGVSAFTPTQMSIFTMINANNRSHGSIEDSIESKFRSCEYKVKNNIKMEEEEKLFCNDILEKYQSDYNPGLSDVVMSIIWFIIGFIILIIVGYYFCLFIYYFIKLLFRFVIAICF